MKFSFQRSYLCSGCEQRFNKNNAKYIYKRSCICKDCYSSFIPYTKDGYFDGSDRIEFMTAAYRYKGIFRDIFLRFKFKSDLAAGHMLGMAVAEQIKSRDSFGEYSYKVCVPISKQRLFMRGYNQSEILAQYISRKLGIPQLNALQRIKHTAPQSKSQHNKRKENVKDAFISLHSFSGENVILFDDIYTTGSTASECTKILHRAGAGKVCVVVGAYNVPRYINTDILPVY